MTDKTDQIVEDAAKNVTERTTNKTPGDFNVNLGGGGGGGSSGGSSGGGSTSSSTSSSSSGSSSSAPAAPKVDPVEAAKASAFQSIYQALWGEPATQEYLKAAVHAGLNVWEFQERERHKPAFRKTQTYRNEAEAWAKMLHGLGVA
jgi:hypothetical protein